MGLNNYGGGFRANGTIAPAVFVKIDTTADGMVLQAGAGDPTIGISQPGQRDAPGLSGSSNIQAALAGDPIQLSGPGDVALITFGGTVTRGDMLKSDGNGKGVTTTTSGDKIGAIALQSGSSGTQGLVLILSPGVSIH